MVISRREALIGANITETDFSWKYNVHMYVHHLFCFTVHSMEL